MRFCPFSLATSLAIKAPDVLASAHDDLVRQEVVLGLDGHDVGVRQLLLAFEVVEEEEADPGAHEAQLVVSRNVDELGEADFAAEVDGLDAVEGPDVPELG